MSNSTLHSLEINKAVPFMSKLSHLLPGWILEYQENDKVGFILCRPRLSPLQGQGWKVHISIGAHELDHVCSILAPTLAAHACAFKIVDSPGSAVIVNSGEAGRSQIGKILTAYPEWSRLPAVVEELVSKLPRSHGPAISMEPQHHSGAPIFFRYGAIAALNTCADEIGMLHFGLVDPTGGLVPDIRGRAAPAWAPKLHVRTRFEDQEERLNAISQHFGFLPLMNMNLSDRNELFYALSIPDATSLIIKIGRRGIAGDLQGKDQADRVCNEARTLGDLDVLKFASSPRMHNSGWFGSDFVLAIQDLSGGDLLAATPSLRDTALTKTIEAVFSLHELGYSHNDLKPSNIIFNNSNIFLIDFELATRFGSLQPLGTNSYATGALLKSPVNRSRDQYALLTTCVCTLLGYDVTSICASVEDICEVVSTICGARTGKKLMKMFERLAQQGSFALNDFREIVAEVQRQQKQGVNRRAKMTLTPCLAFSETFIVKRRDGVFWRNGHIFSAHLAESLNTGSAGGVLAHAVLAETLSCEVLDSALTLASFTKGVHPGLFTGDAGVALALLALYKRTGNRTFRESALLRLRSAAANVIHYDLFSGMAGVVLSGVICADTIGDSEPLSVVAPLRSKLVAAYSETDLWPTSILLGSGGRAQLGAAHGASGIALALGYYSNRATDQMAAHIAVAAFKRVQESIIAGLMPRWLGAEPREKANKWCHGGLGVLWCALWLAKYLPELDAFIPRLALDVMDADPLGDPTVCHGMAGQLEVLRMLGGSGFDGESAIRRANLVAALLKDCAVKQHNHQMWCSEISTRISPDLWVGFLGTCAQMHLYQRQNQHSIISPELLGSLPCN